MEASAFSHVLSWTLAQRVHSHTRPTASGIGVDVCLESSRNVSTSSTLTRADEEAHIALHNKLIGATF